jgi:hypothetical protein
MRSILHGNLRIEVLDGAGVRLDRVTLRQAPPSLTARPMLARERALALLVGRDEELNQVRRAIQAQRPIKFNATCGYGKSTLLRHVAVNAGAQGVAGSCAYLQVGYDLPGCSLVVSSPRPILGRHGRSQRLADLPDDAALQLVASDLGRSLTCQFELTPDTDVSAAFIIVPG